MAIVVVVCGKICGKICGKMCGKMCFKIEKNSDWEKNWCGSRYGPYDYDSGDKKNPLECCHLRLHTWGGP